MAMYSFSIKPHKVDDIMAVDLLKAYCEKEGLSFSNMVVKAIKGFKYDKRGN